MNSVSRFESNLLRILRAFFGPGSLEQVIPLILRPYPRPKCLSRTTVELVQSTLSRGSTLRLATRTGWQRRRHLHQGEISEGSLWERHDPESLGLTFSGHTLDFLIWITSADVASETAVWIPRSQSAASGEGLTVGDHFFLQLAARSMRNVNPMIDRWLKKRVLSSNGLLCLAAPDLFAHAKHVPAPNFDPWMTGIGARVMEAMQDELADCWVAMESQKSRIQAMDHMNHLGQAQSTVLDAFLESATQHGRRDLCHFLTRSAGQVLGPRSNRGDWISGLKLEASRLADRAETYQNASAFLRVVRQLAEWETQSRSVGFMDEDYQASQLWKSIWEAENMPQSVRHAQRVIESLEF